MNILLTGSSGFVGKNFCAAHKVFRCVVRNKKVVNNNPSIFNVESINADTKWDGAFEDIDVVIHLAGLAHSGSFTEQDYQDVNVKGSIHLATEAAKAGVRRLVFVSSIGVNGGFTKDIPFSPSSIPKPHNVYAKSKYDAEEGLKKVSAELGLELVIVRPTLVYGDEAPGNFGMLVRFISKFPFLPFGLAYNRRSFIAVNNLVDLLKICAIHDNAPGNIFLASDVQTVSIREFTNLISRGLGRIVIQLPIPVTFMRFIGKVFGMSMMIEQLYGNLEVDSSNLYEILNWTPPFTVEEVMTTLKNQR